MKRVFQFPERQYRKYDRFRGYDLELDVKTSILISKDLKMMLRSVYDHTEEITLAHGGNEYDTIPKTYYAFYKAFFSHVSMNYWENKVGNLDITRDVQDSPGMFHLSRMRNVAPVQDITEKMTITMPSFVRGIFNRPIKITDLFTLGMGIEYTVSRWFLDSGEVFGSFRSNLEFRVEQNNLIIEQHLERARQIIGKGF